MSDATARRTMLLSGCREGRSRADAARLPGEAHRGGRGRPGRDGRRSTLPREPAASRPHWDRERLLDECLSKRIVLATFGSYLGQTDRTKANSSEIEAWRVLEQAVKGMALPYARHPDYQPHWRINLV